MKNDLEKRIEFLMSQLSQKKALIDNELLQLEKLCKELIMLQDKLAGQEKNE